MVSIFFFFFCLHCLGLSVSRACDHVTLPPFAFVRITARSVGLFLATQTSELLLFPQSNVLRSWEPTKKDTQKQSTQMGCRHLSGYRCTSTHSVCWWSSRSKCWFWRDATTALSQCKLELGALQIKLSLMRDEMLTEVIWCARLKKIWKLSSEIMNGTEPHTATSEGGSVWGGTKQSKHLWLPASYGSVTRTEDPCESRQVVLQRPTKPFQCFSLFLVWQQLSANFFIAILFMGKIKYELFPTVQKRRFVYLQSNLTLFGKSLTPVLPEAAVASQVSVQFLRPPDCSWKGFSANAIETTRLEWSQYLCKKAPNSPQRKLLEMTFYLLSQSNCEAGTDRRCDEILHCAGRTGKRFWFAQFVLLVKHGSQSKAIWKITQVSASLWYLKQPSRISRLHDRGSIIDERAQCRL